MSEWILESERKPKHGRIVPLSLTNGEICWGELMPDNFNWIVYHGESNAATYAWFDLPLPPMP